MATLTDTGFFRQAVELILESEGVLTDRPLSDDPGGLTKYGISQKAYPRLDIRNLTVEQAKGIYLADYWLVNSCHRMPWWAALCVFDCGVNQGVGVAAATIQRVVGVKQDGVLGPVTLAAIHAYDPVTGISQFQGHRGVRYAITSTFARNGRGWMTRLARVSIEAAQGVPHG